MVALVRPDGPEPIAGTPGALMSIVHRWVAGVGSVLPTASIARTSKAWWPSPRPATSSGLAQGSHAAPSRRHSKVAPGSDSNRNDALVATVRPGGATVIVVSGGVVSGGGTGSGCVGGGTTGSGVGAGIGGMTGTGAGGAGWPSPPTDGAQRRRAVTAPDQRVGSNPPRSAVVSVRQPPLCAR